MAVRGGAGRVDRAGDRCPAAAGLARLVPLVIGGTLALLGDLLGVSPGIEALGPFQHVPDPAQAGLDDLQGSLVLIAVAVLTSLLGVLGISRRDLGTR